MIRRLFLLVFVTFITVTAVAGIKDTIQYYMRNKYPSLIGGLSARNTIIGSHYTSVNGVSIGAEYGGKVSFSVGVYNLSNPIIERKTINPYTRSEYVIDEISNFWYLGLTGNYVFYKKNGWTLNVPVRLGFGNANIEQHGIGPGKPLIKETNSFIMPLESGVGAQYKIAWWMGAGAGLGSRIVIGKKTSQKFSGTYYNLGINIYFTDIYYHIRDDIKNNPLPQKRQ